MNKALVLLSGGMKSAIVLHMAKRYNPHVEALLVGCHYSPERKRDCARKLADQAGVFLHEHLVIHGRPDHRKVHQPENLIRLPPYPAWEQVYPRSAENHLRLAGEIADKLACREFYLGMAQPVVSITALPLDDVPVVAPLLYMDSHRVVEMAKELDRGGEANMQAVLCNTWSCEEETSGGQPSPCALCRGCLNRALGFTAAGLPDPLICHYQDKDLYPKEWLNSGLHPVAVQMLEEKNSANK